MSVKDLHVGQLVLLWVLTLALAWFARYVYDETYPPTSFGGGPSVAQAIFILVIVLAAITLGVFAFVATWRWFGARRGR